MSIQTPDALEQAQLLITQLETKILTLQSGLDKHTGAVEGLKLLIQTMADKAAAESAAPSLPESKL